MEASAIRAANNLLFEGIQLMLAMFDLNTVVWFNLSRIMHPFHTANLFDLIPCLVLHNLA